MKKFFEEFIKFINRGNVMDLAVGVIIGGAFQAIVNSLVNDIIMPVISLFTGGYDFSNLSIVLGEGENAASITYGNFISAIINFLIMALVIFLMIKAINKFDEIKNAKLHKGKEEAPAAPTTKVCPYCKSEIDINATRCPHCTSELK